MFMAEVKETRFFGSLFEKGVSWYESQHFSDWSGQTAVGEGTVSYLGNPNAPGRIRAVLGDKVKLIASLRHPVDRAYSAYWMWLARGRIPANADFRTLFYQDHYGLRSQGDYFTHLSRYLEYFPRENFLILIYEEVKKDGQKALGDCFEFLGVDARNSI